MFRFDEELKVYLHREPVDFRLDQWPGGAGGAGAGPGAVRLLRVCVQQSSARPGAGEENFFRFGFTAEEVERVKRDGYRPSNHLAGNDELCEALELVANGQFSRGDR